MLAALVSLLLLVPGSGCRKKRPTRLPQQQSLPDLGLVQTWATRSYEDEESRFRVELPGTPIESEETDPDPDNLVVRHMAQFRDGESELLLMWSELSQVVEGEEAQLAVLKEVVGGWAQAGLDIRENEAGALDACSARILRGTLDRQPVEGRIAICEGTLIQIVASGTYVEDAKRVFDSFIWLP